MLRTNIRYIQYPDLYEGPSNGSYLVDVNNDGILDLVQQTLPSGLKPSTFKPAFTVRIANGDGSFRAPVTYSFAFLTPNTPMLSGDFNGDGSVDLIFGPEDNNQLVLFLGKGDGTFQVPKYITVASPSGQQFGSLLLAADFNGDGKLDLVVPGTRGLYLIPGEGTGNFGSLELTQHFSDSGRRKSSFRRPRFEYCGAEVGERHQRDGKVRTGSLCSVGSRLKSRGPVFFRSEENFRSCFQPHFAMKSLLRILSATAQGNSRRTDSQKIRSSLA